MNHKTFSGKPYNEHGPFYCPCGCSWEDFESMVKLVRIAGNSVRIIKKLIDKNKVPLNPNTHIVYYYARGLY